MAKYLDETGLRRIWNKMKNYVDSKSGSIPNHTLKLSLIADNGGGGNDYRYCDC